MSKRVVHSGANLFAFMVCIVVVCCELPSEQVSAITTIYEIIQNYTTPHSHFVWNNFSKNSNPCSWKGVGCSPHHSSIISITLSSFGISTSEFLPPLCNITTLESLDVSNNYLRSIPDGFFTGCGNVSGLKHLDFSGNRLYGPLPSFNGLQMLLHLDFSRDLLSGEISRELDGLVSLKILGLSDNGFTGRIPTNIGEMKGLEVLALDRNSFTGSIPEELTELTKLQTLMLSFNHLSGPIPAGLSNITSLKLFSAHYNYLYGTIPSAITSHLRSLELRKNMLRGRIPPGLLSAPHLESLHLSGNKLEGPIPAVNSTTLRRLRLGRNSLNGTVPWDSMVGLWHLGLDNNRLTGSLPPVLGNLTNLLVLWLDSNNLVGEIPPQISQLNKLRQLRVGKNSLSGSIPLSISKMQNISYLDLEGNNLHGSIPDSIGNLSCLDKLLLGNNQLSGRIPVSISELQSLRVLDLQGNNLHGPIPDSIGNLSSLVELQLGSNRLSGPIPCMPQTLYIALNLSHNLILGSIPVSLTGLQSLLVLDLQGNKISGPIPNTIRNLSSLMQLQLGNNQLCGRIPYLPEALRIALNLSFNLFGGRIPDSLSNLWRLGVLDLSNNRFSGQIPDFLTLFSGLNHLLLINNNLSGVIPSFRSDVQVDTWGNQYLIHPTQNPSPAPPLRKKKSIHSDFLIAVAAGFPVGLLISIITIFISRRYHTIHGVLSTPNTIHTPAVDFKKAMQAVSDTSSITVKATFSTFYKAVMPSGTTYLVNKFNHTNKIFQFPRHKELVEELQVHGELSNPNVMIPVAYLLTTRAAYLFYDFVRGTLYDILHHRMGCRLDWPSRFTIAVGVSKGLAFLHECTSGPIFLLHLCSKSIMFKSMDVPQISDIELCSLMHPSKTRESMISLDASVGYVPPEYGSTKRVTAAGNVYSLGVVLLELVTGKPAVSEGSELAKWVLSISEQGNGWDEILDSSFSETSVAVRNQMIAVIKVALTCINISPEMRPNSVTVLQMLQNRH